MSFEEVQNSPCIQEDAKHDIPAERRISRGLRLFHKSSGSRRPLTGLMGCKHPEHREILLKILCIFIFQDILEDLGVKVSR